MSESAGGCVYDGLPLPVTRMHIDNDRHVVLGGDTIAHGYLGERELTADAFSTDADGTRWFRTDDLGHIDENGLLVVDGRADDVINTAGHLVGPFEVESALIEHPAVAEAGVIGKPDPVAMEIVKAFVTLKDGYEQTEHLRRELLQFSRQKLGPGVAPREIDFIDVLPKTRSGKIMRRLLKARELGLPEGNTDTLED